MWHTAGMTTEQYANLLPSASQRAGLCVYLLGPLRVELDGGAINLSRRKVESLLVYLLLHPEPQTREQLATLLWGDTADSQARHSLRTALATLRKEVDPDLLLVDRDRVQRNPAFPLWTDLDALLAWEGKLESANSALFQRQLALWQGELAAGLYDEWLTGEREYYRARLLKLFLQVTQTLRTRSDYGAAIAVAQQILTVDPANEEAHQHLMFCYVAAGDRPAALRQYEQCERALQADLDVPPMPATTALYQWIKQQAGAEGGAAAKITNLPIPLTSFVGRTAAMTAVKRLLTPAPQAARLLTLSGAGGSGKTRLAIQVATDLIDRFAHGVWWVELAALTDDAQVVLAVARALGINAAPHVPVLDAIANFVGDKALLLVIDNCEHLIEAVAHLATTLLSRCPNLQLLTTSREALNITGETLWPVPTLSLPDPQEIGLTDLLLQFECIRLFFERATAVQPSFQLTLANAPAVIEICTRLDGIPLAIELAAARVKVLPVEQIAARLTSTLGARFALLTQGQRTAQPRQQTLRAAIDWSYDLLDEAERRLFRLVAVFRGGFTLEALEQVVNAAVMDGLSTIDNLLDLLTQLVDKSLVIVEQQAQTRYHLLETLREYALEQFPTPAEWQAVQHRHALCLLAWAEQAAPHLLESQQQAWLNQFEVEQANLRAALDYLYTSAAYDPAMRLAVAMGRFWGARGYMSEGRAWFEKLLTKRTDAAPSSVAPASVAPTSVAKALNAAGFLSFRQSDFAEALALFTQGLALFQQLDDVQGMAETLQNLASVEIPQGKIALAQQHLEQSLALCQQLQDNYGIARIQQHLGHLAYDQDKLTEARAYFVESLARYRAFGDQVRIANLLLNLGNTVKLLGDHATAQRALQECLTISRAIGHQGLIGTVLRSLGLEALEQKAYTQARLYGEESLQLMRAIGDKSNMGFALLLLGKVAHKLGENQQAVTYYGQNLQIMVALNYRWPIYDVLEQIAALLLETDQQLHAAARFLGVAHAIRQETGNTDATATKDVDQSVTNLRQQLGNDRFNRLWTAGQTAPLAEIVAEVAALSVFDHVA